MYGRKLNQNKIMVIKMKTKRKTNLTISMAIIFLFAISLTTTVNAADPPIMSVDYSDKCEVQNLPISVSVLFAWDEEAFWNQQLLLSVDFDWDTQKDVVTGSNRMSYDYMDAIEGRPDSVLFTIPKEGLNENHTVYFEITYEYLIAGKAVEVLPTTTYKIDILYEGAVADQEADDRTLYIILGSLGAVVLLVVVYIYKKKR